MFWNPPGAPWPNAAGDVLAVRRVPYPHMAVLVPSASAPLTVTVTIPFPSPPWLYSVAYSGGPLQSALLGQALPFGPSAFCPHSPLHGLYRDRLGTSRYLYLSPTWLGTLPATLSQRKRACCSPSLHESHDR